MTSNSAPSPTHVKQDRKRLYAGILVSAGILLFILFAYWQSFIFNPLLISLLVAYILNPIVCLLEKWFSRAASVTMIFILSFGLTGIGLFFISAFAVVEVRNLDVILLGEDHFETQAVQTDHDFWPMPKPEEELLLIKKRKEGVIEAFRLWCLEKARAANREMHFVDSEGALEEAFQWSGLRKLLQTQVGGMDKIGQKGLSVAGWTLSFFWSGLNEFLFLLLYAVLIPIFTFFAMLRLNDLRDMLYVYLPYNQRERIILILSRIYKSISAFFRGRLLIAIILAAIATPSLMLCGLSFSRSLLFSVLFGVIIIVPYVWILSNLIPTLVLINWTTENPAASMVGATAIYCALACLEMFILTPLILGKSVQLHPVLLLVSIFLFGSLFGLFGVLMAVPLASVVKILFEEFAIPRLNLLANSPDKMTPDLSPF